MLVVLEVVGDCTGLVVDMVLKLMPEVL